MDDTTYTLSSTEQEPEDRPAVEQVEAAAASERYVDAGNVRRTYRARCYWLGDALMVHKVGVSDRSDLLLRREIIPADTEAQMQMRLTTIQRNLITGEEVESISLFAEVSSFS